MIDKIQILRTKPKVGQDPSSRDLSGNSLLAGAQAFFQQIATAVGATGLDQLNTIFSDLEKKLNVALKPIESLNKELGNSTIFSAKIFQNFQELSETNKELLLTNQQFQQSAFAINKIIPGTTALLSEQSALTKELLETQTKSTEMLGVQEGNAAAFNTFLLASGNSAQSVYDNLAVTAGIVEEMTGETGVLRDMLNAVGQTTAETRLTFRGSAEELARAALQANRLGTSLAQAEQNADNMLNIESSVGAELEFQQLTGKQILDDQGQSITNQIRLARITGDTSKIAELQADAIRKNYDSLKGDPLALKAFAQSLGMTTAELAQQNEIIQARDNLAKQFNKTTMDNIDALIKDTDAKDLAGMVDSTGKATGELAKILGANATVSKDLASYITSRDVRTQEQRLTDTISILSNAISATFDPSTVKSLLETQQRIAETALSGGLPIIQAGADAITGKDGDVVDVIEKLVKEVKNAITNPKDLSDAVKVGMQTALDNTELYVTISAGEFEKAFLRSSAGKNAGK